MIQAKTEGTSLSYDYILLKGSCSNYSPAIIDTDGALRWVGTAGLKFFSLAFFENAIYIAYGPLIYRNDLDGTVELLGAARARPLERILSFAGSIPRS